MYNHKQEVIDEFVKAIFPVIFKDENSWEDAEIFDRTDTIIARTFDIAEKLFKKHSEDCEICNETAEQPEMD